MASPIVKWAGGKTAILDELMKYVPEKFGVYHEPFAGGAALFFKLEELKRLGGGARLNDSCKPLVQAYEDVRDNIESVIDALRDHRDDFKDEREAHYYLTRNRVNASGWETGDFIFLNRTCYNGLFRVNRKGEFNVQVGAYKNPRICDEPGLAAASIAFKKAAFSSLDFEEAVQKATAGDLVYFDPPYVPIKPGSFTRYGKDGFGAEAQERLAACAEGLVDRGVTVMLSNSRSSWVEDRYAKFTQKIVRAARNVAARAKSRAEVEELILIGGPK